MEEREWWWYRRETEDTRDVRDGSGETTKTAHSSRLPYPVTQQSDGPNHYATWPCSTTAGPGTVAAASGWTLSGLRNVRAGSVGQISFRVTSPSSAQGAGEWVVATATAPLNDLCPIPLQPVTWCADTTDQLTGTGLWDKATGKFRLHCNIGLAASVPLVVSCVYISS